MATTLDRPTGSVFIIPAIVAQKISAVVRRTRTVRLVSGAILALTAASVVLLVAVGIDWLLVLFEPVARRQLTSAAIIAMGMLGLACIALSLLRRVTALDAARQIDEQTPELQERWTSVSEFSTTTDSPQLRGSETMIRRVAEEAARMGQHVEPKQIRMGRELTIACGCLAGAIGLWVVTLAIDPRQVAVLIRRFLSPETAISLTEIRSETGDLLQPRGSNLKLEASVLGRARPSATLSILSAGGTEASHTLELLKGDKLRFAFPLKKIDESFSYRFRSGDGQTPWHKVTVADRPSLKSVDFRIIPPGYSKLPEIRQSGLPKSVKALQGSRLVLQLEANVPLKSMVLQGENKVAHSLSKDQTQQYRWEMDLDESWAFHALLESVQGLGNDHPPRCEIVVYHDQAPVVTVALPTHDVAVRPDDTVTIAYDAKDDLGISHAELVIYDGSRNEELKSIPIPLGDQTGEKSIHAQTELELKDFQLKHGAELTYAIRVYDTMQKATTQRPLDASESSSASSPSEGPPSNSEPSHTELAEATRSDTAHQGSGPQNDPEKQDSEPGKQQAGGGNTWKPKSPGGESTKSPPGGEIAGKPRPDFQMAMRELDTPSGQCSSCARRRITIDEWSGSYASQVLEKLQLQIDPVLTELKQALVSSRDTLRPVAGRAKTGKAWEAADTTGVRTGDRFLSTAEVCVKELTAKSDGTPYAFIGLQLQDISQLHIQPARQHLLDVTLFDAPSNSEDLTTSLVHIQRALDLLEQLTRQYDAVKLNQKLADTMTRVKKMYQIFLEGTFAMLTSQKPNLNPKERAFMELELSDEFLKRLQALLKKKLEIQAELAKVLSKDPRLLERFMATSRLEATTLRDQLTLLNQSQQQLVQELEAGLPPADQPAAKFEWKNRIPRRVAEAGRSAEEAAKMLDNYIVWTPLGLDVDQGGLATFKADLIELVATASEWSTQAGEPEVAASLNSADRLYRQLREFKETLPELLDGDSHPKLPTHLANRAEEAATLITDVSGWIHKERMMESGQHHLAAEVDQHRITVNTMELTRKLTSLQAQCQGISPKLGQAAEAFLATMELELVPELEFSQQTLGDNQVPSAIEHQTAAIACFTKAERELDAVMDGIIKYLDSFPYDKNPSPPVEMPESLDNLLAMLEDEARAAESLGIPCCRPSNLLIEKDWLQPGSSAGSGSGSARGSGSGRSPRPSMNAQAPMNQAKEADALAERIRNETEAALKELMRGSGSTVARGIAKKHERAWDTLGSKLEDHMRQGRGNLPPEQYRKAIELYFESLAGKTSPTLSVP